jgi:hypothetical protein
MYYGITRNIEGPTKWYSGPPVGEDGRTVSVRMSNDLFDKLTTAAKVEGKTPGCVVREAFEEYAKKLIEDEDPEFLQEVEDLAIRLDRHSSSSNPRESK